MVRYLCIVGRDQPDLFDHLIREFSKDMEALVLLDRRRGDRRRGSPRHAPDRRGTDRRRQPGIDQDIRSIGFMVTRLQPEAYRAGRPAPTGAPSGRGE